MVREAYPRELFAVLRSAGQRIEERFPDIYYVTGRVMFDTQVVLTGRLKGESHSALRILSRAAGREDIRRFLDEIPSLKAPVDRHNFQLGCPPLQARRALSGG